MATVPKIVIQLLNEHEVAELLGVKVATVRHWRQSQRGPRYLKVGGAVRYAEDDVVAWIRSRPSGGEIIQPDAPTNQSDVVAVS
jgi:predicted DNA-binding transcriptional regulator AlpA